MDDLTDYEALPPSSSLGIHLLAGACAGIMEHTIMYPFDLVKTRMQCLRPINGQPYANAVQGITSLIYTEGLRGSLRGIGAMVGGAGPAHAAYFACYEHIKSSLEGTALGSRHAAPVIGGALATLLHDAVMTPADAVKQRLQIFNSPYRNSLDCLRRVCLVEGPRVLYRAYFTQLTMNVPYQAVHFVCYEASQDALNPSRSYLPWTHIVAGGLAGGFAAACTNPLDVCKTMLNTQDRCALTDSASRLSSSTAQPSAATKPPLHRSAMVRGLFGSARMVYSLEGLQGFTRGMGARVLSAVPGTAISWSVYEYFKWLLKTTGRPPEAFTPPPDSPPSHQTSVSGSPWYATSKTRGGMTCAASSPLDGRK